jgi:hypothetical protein
MSEDCTHWNTIVFCNSSPVITNHSETVAFVKDKSVFVLVFEFDLSVSGTLGGIGPVLRSNS